MPPGGFIAIGKSPTDLQSVYGIANVLGPYAGSLGVSGTVRLRNNTGAIFLEVSYSNQPPWPVASPDAGALLSRVQVTA